MNIKNVLMPVTTNCPSCRGRIVSVCVLQWGLQVLRPRSHPNEWENDMFIYRITHLSSGRVWSEPGIKECDDDCPGVSARRVPSTRAGVSQAHFDLCITCRYVNVYHGCFFCLFFSFPFELEHMYLLHIWLLEYIVQFRRKKKGHARFCLIRSQNEKEKKKSEWPHVVCVQGRGHGEGARRRRTDVSSLLLLLLRVLWKESPAWLSEWAWRREAAAPADESNTSHLHRLFFVCITNLKSEWTRDRGGTWDNADVHVKRSVTQSGELYQSVLVIHGSVPGCVRLPTLTPGGWGGVGLHRVALTGEEHLMALLSLQCSKGHTRQHFTEIVVCMFLWVCVCVSERETSS